MSIFRFLFLGLSVACSPLYADNLQNRELPPFEEGRILFLLQQGDSTQALSVYQKNSERLGQHQFELLHQIALFLLQEGSSQRDPETQLLTLFGAGISMHEQAESILEAGLASPFAEIQLVALQGLSQLQQDRSDRAILKALSSNYLVVRLQALYQLASKKDLHALEQAESLVCKTPRSLLPVYPPIFAMIGTQKAIRELKKLFNNPHQEARLAALISAGLYHRDDLLPQIRQQCKSGHFKEQEAAASVIGALGDGTALPLLKQLTLSQYPNVKIAAALSLYKLGDENAASILLHAAQEGDPFAITALGTVSGSTELLVQLSQPSNLPIRFNALLALHAQRHPAAASRMQEILIRDQRDLGFISLSSPGKTLSGWKIVPSAQRLLKNEIESFHTHLKLKETILEEIWNTSKEDFFLLADQIVEARQEDLIPLTIRLMQELGTPQAIDWLKCRSKTLGAPIIRNYCNLALYHLREEGDFGEQLRAWARSESLRAFIRFQPFSPWEPGTAHYALTPEQKSQLLIQTFEAFATQRDASGISELVEAIRSGNTKNRYALAGLLLRATE